jgi:hypothetical protein
MDATIVDGGPNVFITEMRAVDIKEGMSIVNPLEDAMTCKNTLEIWAGIMRGYTIVELSKERAEDWVRMLGDSSAQPRSVEGLSSQSQLLIR